MAGYEDKRERLDALRELRVKAGGDQIRIAYAFDPARDAVLLLGAAKVGDDRFYKWFVPKAETQGEVSRFEQRSDHRIGRMREMVEAVGGKLKVVAIVDGKEIRIG